MEETSHVEDGKVILFKSVDDYESGINLKYKGIFQKR